MGFTILKPTHLLFINLVTDSFPALALGLERPERDIMQRKARKATDGIFAGGLGIDALYQGILVTILTVIAYYLGKAGDTNIVTENGMVLSQMGMTMAFLTMSMCEIFHSFNMRSQRNSVFTMGSHNIVLYGAMIASLILTTVIIEVPFLAAAFDFVNLDFTHYAESIGLAISIIPVVEFVKLIQRAASKKKN
ncbi:Calcium-transporting ATPase 1 [bioreactor metagenome]|uniref:Calcium-transporting ATPase 1 n=1 Tax=bioreactor metagenome TaxID=1076179 RepID=A0A645DUN0_9ZZZZ